jgi:Rps23 Pro-64 3,4-dihydroxylase Tpa1-like proline 4-hydroxylase
MIEGLKRPFLLLENALIPAVADRLHAELVQSAYWDRQSIADPGFVYRRDAIVMGSEHAPEILNDLHAYLSSEECLAWVSEVSGRACDSFQGAAAIFKPGDQISRHNDKRILTRDDGSKTVRAVTFNYYLTKQWDARWGGRLIWENPYTEILPTFNTLVMFNVGQDTHHWVEPVHDGVTTRRLSITGWFMSTVPGDANPAKKLRLKI